jgi:hypothetical protein
MTERSVVNLALVASAAQLTIGKPPSAIDPMPRNSRRLNRPWGDVKESMAGAPESAVVRRVR